jgi:hypothetical protein
MLPFDANGEDSESKFIVLKISCPELTHNCLLLLYIVVMFKPMFKEMIFSYFAAYNFACILFACCSL